MKCVVQFTYSVRMYVCYETTNANSKLKLHTQEHRMQVCTRKIFFIISYCVWLSQQSFFYLKPCRHTQLFLELLNYYLTLDMRRLVLGLAYCVIQRNDTTATDSISQCHLLRYILTLCLGDRTRFDRKKIQYEQKKLSFLVIFILHAPAQYFCCTFGGLFAPSLSARLRIRSEIDQL